MRDLDDDDRCVPCQRVGTVSATTRPAPAVSALASHLARRRPGNGEAGRRVTDPSALQQAPLLQG